MRVHVNAAASVDGKIARPGGARLRLSGPEDLSRVHALRDASDAILVGVNTVIADDPSLLTKAEHLGRAPERQPLRVVLDSRARSPSSALVFDGRARTLVLVSHAAGAARFPNAEVAAAGRDRVDLRHALRELSARGVHRLLVEGGGTVIASFLAAGLADEVTVYVAPVVVGGGAPSLAEGALAGGPIDLRIVDVERLGEGFLVRYHPARGPAP